MDHLLKSVVWERIRAHESETFTQIRGGEFSYLVRGDALKLDRTDWFVPHSHIDEALDLVPLENTVPVQHLFGPSYMYAVLMDPRIKRDDW